MIGRLRGRDTFDRLRREGTRVRSGVLSMTMLVDPSSSGAHVGYAIGRSVGPAVVRNRVRRRLRAVVQARADVLPPGWYLIGCSPAAARCSFDRLGADLDAALTRLGVGAR